MSQPVEVDSGLIFGIGVKNIGCCWLGQNHHLAEIQRYLEREKTVKPIFWVSLSKNLGT